MTTSTHGLGLGSIAEVDPVLWDAMLGERRRQHDKIELIASENYVSAAVMEAQGSWLTNKYAEGLPGKRYYGGCEFVDIAETLAQERALALFPGAEHVKVGGKKPAGVLRLGDKCDSCVILQICGSCHDDANDPGFRFEVEQKIERIRHGELGTGTFRKSR